MSPEPNPLRVLLVEDSHADALVAERALEVSDGVFEITITDSLGAGIDRLTQGFDAILLDLTLPDSAGTDTVVLGFTRSELAPRPSRPLLVGRFGRTRKDRSRA